MKQSVQPYLFLLFWSFFFCAESIRAAPGFVMEEGIRLSTAQAQDITGTYPNIRMYFTRNFQVLSATSADGKTWSEETGVRVSSATLPNINVTSVTACALIPLSIGGFRMIYSVNGTTNNFKIVSATSSNGLAWANDTGTRIEVNGGATFVGSPKVVQTAAGTWRLYYILDTVGANNPADYRPRTATSTDEGLTWTTNSTNMIAERAGQIAVSTRTDNRVRLFYTTPLTAATTNTQVLSGLANGTTGDAFTIENTNVRFATSTTGELTYPVVFRSTNSHQYRLYYSFRVTGSLIPTMYSALASTPVITGMTPAAVNRGSAAQSFTITGEVFSSTPTLSLTKTGETSLVGSSLNRINDQSMTVTFNTLGQALGQWNLVVTNNDGATQTFTNALIINFASGEFVLTDNLFRPLLGQSMTVDVTIFDSGNVSLKIYTLDGRLVKTLFDAFQPTGSFTAPPWNGTNSDGKVVASGVYFIHLLGPKLEDKKKIVVIK